MFSDPQNCDQYPFWDGERVTKGYNLKVNQMLTLFEGLYYCRVRYTRKNLTLTFTRALNVSAVCKTRTTTALLIILP